MSLWNTIKGAATGFVTGGLPGAIIGGGLSMIGGGAVSKVGKLSKVQTTTSRGMVPLPGGGGGKLPPIIAGAAGAAGAAGRKIASYARGAASMCSKYPQWCLAVGGVSAIAAMMQSGQLPKPRRRRAHGITPRDLRSFRRVATLIKNYSAPVHRTRLPRGRKTCR